MILYRPDIVTPDQNFKTAAIVSRLVRIHCRLLSWVLSRCCCAAAAEVGVSWKWMCCFVQCVYIIHSLIRKIHRFRFQNAFEFQKFQNIHVKQSSNSIHVRNKFNLVYVQRNTNDSLIFHSLIWIFDIICQYKLFSVHPHFSIYV